VVLVGSCRDTEDIREMGFPVFSRGDNPSGTEKASLAQIGVPVICGGVEVHNGDIVLGDCDGVVVVPQTREDEVFEKAFQKFEKEQHIVEQLLAGKTTLEIYGFDKLIEKLENL
jgi:4-hydroxy-4-methyl-2-oxoglutarate aldolase